MPIDHYNACEAFAREQLERSTCRVLTQIGFTHANDSSLDLITDITRRYMQTMCSTVKWVADHCGRTDVTLGDMEFVYDKMRISVAEMSMYMKQVRPLSPRLIARFPASPPSKADLSAPAKKPRPAHVPEWASPGTNDVAAVIQRSVARTSEPLSRLALPDFTNHTAFSLGLCKSNQQNVLGIHKPEPLSRQSSYAPSTRPASRNEPPSNFRTDTARQVPLPSAMVELEGLSVQIVSGSGTPVVSPVEKGSTAQPAFKRRITKRKSQDDSASPSPAPISSNLLAQQAGTRKDSDGTTALNDVGKTPGTANKLMIKKIVDTRTSSTSAPPRSSANLLTLASDLAREPRCVIVAALSGRSAVSHHNDHPLPVPPISKLNIRGPPGQNETPKEILQASVLRALFTPDCNMQKEVQEALAFAKTLPSSSLCAPAAIQQQAPTIPPSTDLFSESPVGGPLAESSAHNSPAYEIIKSEESIEKTGLLKIRLRRSSFGLPNADSPQPQDDNRNKIDVSQDILQEHSDKPKKKKKKEKKRDKKDRKRSREEAPTEAVADVSSPVCVADSGGLKLKIKFGGPRP